LQNDLKDFIFIYLEQNNLRNLIVDFIAAFSFEVLMLSVNFSRVVSESNDCIFIEKYIKIVLDLMQLSIINLRRTSYLPME
jgi:hypothetical protein